MTIHTRLLEFVWVCNSGKRGHTLAHNRLQFAERFVACMVNVAIRASGALTLDYVTKFMNGVEGILEIEVRTAEAGIVRCNAVSDAVGVTERLAERVARVRALIRELQEQHVPALQTAPLDVWCRIQVAGRIGQIGAEITLIRMRIDFT